jgi:hypothetical protein
MALKLCASWNRSGCSYGVKPYFAIFLNECSPNTGGDRGKAECGASAEGWRERPALALFLFSRNEIAALDVQLLRRSRRLPRDHGILQHTCHVARSALGWHVRKKFLLRKSESVVHDLLGRTAGHLRHAFNPRTRFFQNGQLHHSPQVSALKLSRLS